MLKTSFELAVKAYGEKHMLVLRLYLNIGILYEDNRDYQKAYDYFLQWNHVCMEVRPSVFFLDLLVLWPDFEVMSKLC